MRQRFYRIALIIFSTWDLLVLGTLLQIPIRTGHFVEGFVFLLIWLCIPIAAIGLWNLKRWGICYLMVGTVALMLLGATGGVVQMLSMSMLHLLVVAITILRLFSRSREKQNVVGAAAS